MAIPGSMCVIVVASRLDDPGLVAQFMAVYDIILRWTGDAFRPIFSRLPVL